MGLGVGSQIIKVILFIFNLLWLLFGVVLVIVGALIYTETGGFLKEHLKDIDMPAFAMFMMAVGIITIVISFCGCCGAMQESQFMTLTYSVLLFIIIIVEVTVAIIIFVKLKDSTVDELISKHIGHLFDDKGKAELIDELQAIGKCCGKTGPDHWNGNIPDSCCPAEKKPCVHNIDYFQDGCSTKMIEFVVKHKNTLAYSSLGFAIVELIAFVFSCILAQKMD